MPRTTSNPTILVQCYECYALHPAGYQGNCENERFTYRSVEDYVNQHKDVVQPVEVLEFA